MQLQIQQKDRTPLDLQSMIWKTQICRRIWRGKRCIDSGINAGRLLFQLKTLRTKAVENDIRKKKKDGKSKNTVENSVDPVEGGQRKFQLAELLANAIVFRCT